MATPTPTAIHTTRTVDLASGLSVTIDEFGQNTAGQAVLVLHGGTGPRTVTGLASALSQHGYAIAPTHPGSTAHPDQSGRTASPTWPRPTWACWKT